MAAATAAESLVSLSNTSCLKRALAFRLAFLYRVSLTVRVYTRVVYTYQRYLVALLRFIQSRCTLKAWFSFYRLTLLTLRSIPRLTRKPIGPSGKSRNPFKKAEGDALFRDPSTLYITWRAAPPVFLRQRKMMKKKKRVRRVIYNSSPLFRTTELDSEWETPVGTCVLCALSLQVRCCTSHIPAKLAKSTPYTGLW